MVLRTKSYLGPAAEPTGQTTSDVSSRLARWRVTGDPTALWPNVRPETLAAAHHRITAVTSATLAGAEPRQRLGVADTHDLEAFGVAAFVSGMGPLIGYWIERGVIDADSTVRDLLAIHLEHGRQRARRLHLQLVRILQEFNDRGLAPTVLKGAYTSRSYFPEAGVRPIADIDLLVTTDQRAEAEEALRSAGLVMHRSEMGEQTEWRLPDASKTVHSLELDHASNPWAVDLHTTVDKRYFYGLWASFGLHSYTSTIPWRVDGLSARVFAQPLLTAHLAQHAAYTIHELRLVRLVELVLVIRRDAAAGTFQWEALAALLADTKTARFVYPALELAERLAPGVIDPAFRSELAAASTPRMRRVVDRIAACGMHLAGRGTLDERLMWACGWAELARNVADFLWPPADSLRDRGWKYSKWIRMALRGRIAMRS